MQFTPFEKSPNQDEIVTKKIGWVFHGTLGNFSSAKDALTTLERIDGAGRNIGRASTHLLIARDGSFVWLVQPQFVAWHAGKISNPKDNFKRIAKKNPDGSYVNPNQYMLGVEFCWGYDINKNKKIDKEERRCTDAQLKTFNEQRLLVEKMGLCPQPNGENYITHHDLTDYKTDDLTEDIARFFSLYVNPAGAHPVKEPFIIARTIRVGASGKDVQQLQAILRHAECFIYPQDTGFFGWITDTSVKMFQKKYALYSDGIVGNKTIAVLKSIYDRM